ncbi:MAG: hypothetical protein ABEK75_03085 [Salinibacter sp.]
MPCFLLDVFPPFEAFFGEPCLPLLSVDDLDDVDTPFRLSPCAFDAEEDLSLPEDFASLISFEPPFTFEAVPSVDPVDPAVPDALFPDPDCFWAACFCGDLPDERPASPDDAPFGAAFDCVFFFCPSPWSFPPDSAVVPPLGLDCAPSPALPLPFDDSLEPPLWWPGGSPPVSAEALRPSMVATSDAPSRFVAVSSPAPPSTRTGSPVVPPSGIKEGDDCLPRATSAPSRADAKDCAEPASDALRAASEAAAASPDKERENDCMR